MTRRTMLAGAAFVAGAGLARRVGAQGLSGFTSTTADPSCRGDRVPTPAAPSDFYKTGAPERSSFREPGMAGTPLRLSGAVIGVRCGAVAGARLEFWQADAAGAFDGRGFRLRGHEQTDAKGRYVLETIVPGARDGHAKRLYVRISIDGRATLSTQLFFPDDSAAARDPAFRAALVISVTRTSAPETATFDFILDR